jgi:hypothetical protein
MPLQSENDVFAGALETLINKIPPSPFSSSALHSLKKTREHPDALEQARALQSLVENIRRNLSALAEPQKSQAIAALEQAALTHGQSVSDELASQEQLRHQELARKQQDELLRGQQEEAARQEQERLQKQAQEEQRHWLEGFRQKDPSMASIYELYVDDFPVQTSSAAAKPDPMLLEKLQQFEAQTSDTDLPTSEQCPPLRKAEIKQQLPEVVSLNNFIAELRRCARGAEDTINEREFGSQTGKGFFGDRKIINTPRTEQCEEPIVDPKNRTERIRRKLVLGTLKHDWAEACVRTAMAEKTLEGGVEFKIEATYSKSGQFQGENVIMEDSIRPDVVIHQRGNPDHVLHVFDFKFPCPPSNSANWRTYDKGLYKGRRQDDVYRDLLRVNPSIIRP